MLLTTALSCVLPWCSIRLQKYCSWKYCLIVESLNMSTSCRGTQEGRAWKVLLLATALSCVLFLMLNELIKNTIWSSNRHMCITGILGDAASSAWNAAQDPASEQSKMEHHGFWWRGVCARAFSCVTVKNELISCNVFSGAWSHSPRTWSEK